MFSVFTGAEALIVLCGSMNTRCSWAEEIGAEPVSSTLSATVTQEGPPAEFVPAGWMFSNVAASVGKGVDGGAGGAGGALVAGGGAGVIGPLAAGGGEL